MAKLWTPLDLTKLPDCNIIACDPSLTALGLVLLEVCDGEVTVHGAEKLSTVPTDRKGWDDTFYRSRVMESLVAAYMDKMVTNSDVLAVNEAPPAGGGDFVRIESSALTGYGFQSVAEELGLQIDRTVTPQSHKKLISGNHLAKKTEHHTALKKLMVDIRGSEAVKNEATRDALSIGLYVAHRRGQDG